MTRSPRFKSENYLHMQVSPPDLAGNGLLHGVPIAAMAVLVANDHLFKIWWPGALTGKLSDIAGLAFFPLLLQAAWEVATRGRPSRRVLVACALATGVVFALVNTWAPADAAYRLALGALQWIPRGEFVAVQHVSDAGDLAALPALLLALHAGWRRE